MSEKPANFKKPFDPITPTHLAPEDEKILRDIRIAALSSQPTSELTALTTGKMKALPPHTLHILSSEDPDIFGEIQGAVCRQLRSHRWNIPRGIILPPPIYERLEFDVLTQKPFSKFYLFIVAGMQRPHIIPVYLDLHVGISLPHDTIMCLLS